MAAPTQPTKTTICTEALKRYLDGATPESADITRAEDYGLEKVKRDIMAIGKTWRPLLRTAYDITKVGVSHYDNSADYEIDFTVGLMTGTHSGLLTNVASTSTMTLAADEDATQIECEGKWLLITSGTGVDQAEQIDDYNTTTKVVTLAAALTTLPVLGDGYLVVNNIEDLRYLHPRLYDKFDYPGTRGTPSRYTRIENQSVGQIALYPVPNAVRGLRRRYYADLRKMDMALTIYNTILRRWADVFEQGVFVWALGEDDDRHDQQNQIYANMLMLTAQKDLDGFVMPAQEKQ